jgi:hypothetical protein
MFTALAIALIASTAAPAAETSGEIIFYNGHSIVARADAGFELVDEGELVSGMQIDDKYLITAAHILWAPETGRLYGHGEDAEGRWVLNGQCDDDDECTVEVLSFTGTSVASVVVSASVEALVYNDTFEVGPLSFKVEWGGEKLSVFFVEQTVYPAESVVIGDPGSGKTTLLGFLNADTGELSMSWLPADGGLDAALVVEADCGVTSRDYLVCSGGADLWQQSSGKVTTLGYWGYEHMTTVKGFESVTLPHNDGLLLR